MSCPNSATSSGVRARRVCPIGVRDVTRGHLLLATLEHDALKRQLRRPARGELDIGRGEQPHPAVDRELYLPKSWTGDRDRCREAGVPDDVQFATKAELARAMLGRALDAGVPAAWVTADEAYGRDGKFRAWLDQRRIGYVVAVAVNQAIAGDAGTSRADVLAANAPDQAWKRRSCGNGAKGPRLFDWAAATLPDDEGTTPPGWSRYLLVRRSLTRNAKGELELAYYLCCAPDGTTDEELIRVAGSRWAVEECFQAAKNETGLDHYQVRRYDAWYRHVTLAVLAHAYLAVTAATAPKALAAASSRSRSARSAVSWHT
jgi:SRSO17 transposase